ncbi:potassium transporter TrkG, partial [Thermoproteota archaeon]
MNSITITKIIAILSLTVSLFMLAPIFLAWRYNEMSIFIPFIIIFLCSCLISAAVLYVYRKHTIYKLSTRDGILLVTLSWISVSFIGALPFFFTGIIPNFADAFFETMSGFTTTGASILTNIEAMPKSLLFWRSLTHWLGGMGIVVLTVAILPILGIGGLQLLKAEAPGPTVDKIT